MTDQHRIRDAQEKIAASIRSPLVPTAVGIAYQVNGRMVARPTGCSPPHRRARE